MAERARLDGWYLCVWCPACNTAHGVTVAPGPNPWAWNGSLERPTLTPSLGTRFPGRPGDYCHSYVTDGRIRFLDDSTHELKGQDVELPAWPFPKEDARG